MVKAIRDPANPPNFAVGKISCGRGITAKLNKCIQFGRGGLRSLINPNIMQLCFCNYGRYTIILLVVYLHRLHSGLEAVLLQDYR